MVLHADIPIPTEILHQIIDIVYHLHLADIRMYPRRPMRKDDHVSFTSLSLVCRRWADAVIPLAFSRSVWDFQSEKRYHHRWSPAICQMIRSLDFTLAVPEDLVILEAVKSTVQSLRIHYQIDPEYQSSYDPISQSADLFALPKFCRLKKLYIVSKQSNVLSILLQRQELPKSLRYLDINIPTLQFDEVDIFSALRLDSLTLRCHIRPEIFPGSTRRQIPCNVRSLAIQTSHVNHLCAIGPTLRSLELTIDMVEPIAIPPLPMLEILSVRGPHPREVNWRQLKGEFFEFFPNLHLSTRLRHLSIGDCRLSNAPLDLVRRNSKSVVSFQLENCELDWPSIKEWHSLLSENIVCLKLQENRILPVELESEFLSLMFNERITSLSLFHFKRAYNTLSDAKKVLIKYLERCTSLKLLSIRSLIDMSLLPQICFLQLEYLHLSIYGGNFYIPLSIEGFTKLKRLHLDFPYRPPYAMQNINGKGNLKITTSSRSSNFVWDQWNELYHGPSIGTISDQLESWKMSIRPLKNVW